MNHKTLVTIICHVSLKSQTITLQGRQKQLY